MVLFDKKTEEIEPKADVVSNLPVVKDFVSAVLVQPRISEKAGRLAKENKYVFKVKVTANKIEVRKAIENQYRVKVVNVNMIRNVGKKRTYGGKSGLTSNFKKAIVTLKPGDKIELALETV